MCPVFKSGAENDFTNYRAISILPSFSKIFERAVYNRLSNYIELCNILVKNQFGFGPKHSTYMALQGLYDKVSASLDNFEFCVGILHRSV